MIDIILNTLERARDNTITSHMVLEQDQRDLNEMKKSIRSAEDKEGVQFQDVTTEFGVTSLMSALLKAQDILTRRIETLQDQKKANQKRQEATSQGVLKSVSNAPMPKLTGPSTYLEFKEFIVNFIRQSGCCQDNNLALINSMNDAASNEYKVFVKQAGHSVNGIMRALSNIFDNNLVHQIFGSDQGCYLITELPNPDWRRRGQILKSINTIKNHIRLFRMFRFIRIIDYLV